VCLGRIQSTQSTTFVLQSNCVKVAVSMFPHDVFLAHIANMGSTGARQFVAAVVLDEELVATGALTDKCRRHGFFHVPASLVRLSFPYFRLRTAPLGIVIGLASSATRFMRTLRTSKDSLWAKGLKSTRGAIAGLGTRHLVRKNSRSAMTSRTTSRLAN
jgi:hypothetical protein